MIFVIVPKDLRFRIDRALCSEFMQGLWSSGFAVEGLRFVVAGLRRSRSL